MDFRKQRMERLILEEISDIFEKKINDPKFQNINIVAVDISNDLRNAKVYYSSFFSGKTYKESDFEKVSGFVSRELFRRLRIKNPLTLKFLNE